MTLLAFFIIVCAVLAVGFGLAVSDRNWALNEVDRWRAYAHERCDIINRLNKEKTALLAAKVAAEQFQDQYWAAWEKAEARLAQARKALNGDD